MNYTAAKKFILDKLENELSDKLYYHGKHHTLDVLEITTQLCQLENIAPKETTLLKTAALFHDSGFIYTRTEHEKMSCQIVKAYLPDFGYSAKDIQVVCGMIMATKIPQTPHTALEQILCDADLDYLGRDDFYSIGYSLFEELKAFEVVQSINIWNQIQVSFLETHRYFTKTNQEKRTKKKEKYLQELKTLVATY